MFQVDQPTAATSLPTPSAAGTPGYFTNGNPASGIPATVLEADFTNMVMMELLNVVTASGLTPSKTTYTQVRDAIKQLILGGAGVSPTIGSVRNQYMYITTPAASATMTADEIVVGSALGGLKYTLSAFNKTINLATTGAGGMDTGAAPASGFVALYAIYNPTSGASALLAANASTMQSNAYAGANMPAGYTASALIAVWPTNSSSQLIGGLLRDRTFAFPPALVLTSSTNAATPTALSVASTIPLNAKKISGSMTCSSTVSTTITINVSGGPGRSGEQGTNGITTSLGGGYSKIDLVTPQTLYYLASASAGTPSFNIYISSYEI